MINKLEEIVRKVGQEIINSREKDLHRIELKKDKSPLTRADKLSSKLLTDYLKNILDIPVLSEEAVIAYDVRKHWDFYWMIDPLDGTKEFINGYDDFCINIALINNNQPYLGVIFAPLLNEFYVGGVETKFQYLGPTIPVQKSEQNISVVTSRFHKSTFMEHYIQAHQVNNVVEIGSAIKFGRVALGEFSLYPRFQGSYEWDTAAGQAIIKSSGGKIIDLITCKELVYNKQDLRNNFFIAYNE
jgi:3'(2'), 5'-bisphosphate nucleotidase